MTDRKDIPDEVMGVMVESLSKGFSVKIKVSGTSMYPCIRHEDVVMVSPQGVQHLRKGEVVCFRKDGRLVAHRIRKIFPEGSIITGGDFYRQDDPEIETEKILGKAISLQRGGHERRIRRRNPHFISFLRPFSKLRYRMTFRPQSQNFS